MGLQIKVKLGGMSNFAINDGSSRAIPELISSVALVLWEETDMMSLWRGKNG